MRKKILQIHLWLGFLSGIVIVIMAVTGALYAFAEEIKTVGIEAVNPQGEIFYTPGQLKEILVPELRKLEGGDVVAYGVTYQPAPKPSMLTYSSQNTSYGNVYINPYTAEILGKPTGEDFFNWVMAGHRSLWLPLTIGRLIIGWSMVIFVIELLTGLILWFPRRWNRKAIRQRLTVKTNGGHRRFFYDLHNSLGGLILLPILAITFTGLTWSFPLLAKGYYTLLSSKTYHEWSMPVSDTTHVDTAKINDEAMWDKVLMRKPDMKTSSVRFDFPMGNTGIYTVVFNPKPGKNYSNDYHFYDRYSLRELAGGGVYGLSQSQVNGGDILFRMSYDIHSGAIVGIPGKLIAFLLSIIAASLPITGCVIWLMKRKK